MKKIRRSPKDEDIKLPAGTKQGDLVATTLTDYSEDGKHFITNTWKTVMKTDTEFGEWEFVGESE